MSETRKEPLKVFIRTHVRNEDRAKLLERTVKSAREAGFQKVVIVDDQSPLGDKVKEISKAHSCEYHKSGFKPSVENGLYWSLYYDTEGTGLHICDDVDLASHDFYENPPEGGWGLISYFAVYPRNVDDGWWKYPAEKFYAALACRYSKELREGYLAFFEKAMSGEIPWPHLPDDMIVKKLCISLNLTIWNTGWDYAQHTGAKVTTMGTGHDADYVTEYFYSQVKTEEPKRKTEVLFWADSPTTSTGFATVSRNILKVLDKTEKYRFTVMGISHHGIPYDTKVHPYLEFPKHGGLFSAQEGDDIYGFKKAMRLLSSGNFDILFILNDPFVMKFAMPQIVALRNSLAKKFKIVFYFPVDSEVKEEWARVVGAADFPVAYTQFGRQAMEAKLPELKDRLRVIYHGTDKEVFRPLVGPAREALKQAIFGHNARKFVILNVNRNQPRKDLNSTFEVFAKVHAEKPETFLYILASMNDVGGNLQEIASHHGLVLGQDWECPNPKMYSPSQGMPIENVVQLYAAADLVITTTLGEGWGLSITEAMACRKPIVAPRHTSIQEIIGENEERGWLVPCGGYGHTVSQGPNDNNNVRPVVHHQEMVDRIRKVMDYPNQSAKKVDAAFEWVPTWEEVGQEWLAVFEQASLVDAPEVGTEAP